jgi:hypothetical protein
MIKLISVEGQAGRSDECYLCLVIVEIETKSATVQIVCVYMLVIHCL